jgi:predicted transcriptional regulator
MEVRQMKTKFVAVRMDTETLKKLREIAIRMDRPISWVVRKACKDFAEKEGSK